MAQKKAFVRYAQNKAVPGSLIVRTKAPKVGTWKEVPYDICCGGGGCTPRVYDPFVTFESQENLFTAEFNSTQFVWNCTDLLPGFTAANGGLSILVQSPSTFTFSNWDDVINFLNTNLSTIGVFSYLGGTSIQVITTPSVNEYIQCSNATFNLEFYLA
jgi:hypothetical protein